MSSGASLDLGTKIVKKTVRLGNGWNPHENQPHGSGYPYIRVRAPSGGKQDGKSPLQFFFAITFKVTIEWKLTVQIPQGRGHTCCQFEPEG